MSDPRIHPRVRLALNEIVDDRFLAALERLRIVARRVAARGRPAEQRSMDRGGGVEFKDFRPYAPGDDLRRVDWNVYRRSGKVFLRLFEELEDLPLYVLPDVSASAWFEQPPRVKAGLRVALALSSIALSQHDRVSVIPISDDARWLVRGTSGKGRVLTIASRFTQIEPGGRTDLVRSLATFSAMPLRPGLACIISDFFDPSGIEAVLQAIARLRHRVLLVRLVRMSDQAPALAGDIRLIDCETNSATDVAITPTTLARYREEVERFDRALAAFAMARGAGLVEIDVEREVVPQLERLFDAGSLRT